jgi:hypothetical protein
LIQLSTINPGNLPKPEACSSLFDLADDLPFADWSVIRYDAHTE